MQTIDYGDKSYLYTPPNSTEVRGDPYSRRGMSNFSDFWDCIIDDVTSDLDDTDGYEDVTRAYQIAEEHYEDDDGNEIEVTDKEMKEAQKIYDQAEAVYIKKNFVHDVLGSGMNQTEFENRFQ